MPARLRRGAYETDCAEPLPGAVFALDDLAIDGPSDIADNRTADARGVALWEGLGAKPYALAAVTGAEAEQYAVSCTIEADPLRPLDVTDTGRGALRFEVPAAVVAADDDLFCDWYVIPGSVREAAGSLTIEARRCVAGYAPLDETTYAEDGTHPATGVKFNATFGAAANAAAPDATVSTDLAGVARFELPIGETEVLLVEGAAGAPDPFGGNELGLVFCAIGEREEVPFDYVQGDGILLGVAAGEAVTCTWYVVPPAGTQPFPVYALVCDQDPGQVGTARGDFPPAGCAGAVGVAILVEAAENGDDLGACTTGDDGSCVIDLPRGASVLVSDGPASIPPGFEARQNPIETRVVTEFAEAVFVNLPV